MWKQIILMLDDFPWILELGLTMATRVTIVVTPQTQTQTQTRMMVRLAWGGGERDLWLLFLSSRHTPELATKPLSLEHLAKAANKGLIDMINMQLIIL